MLNLACSTSAVVSASVMGLRNITCTVRRCVDQCIWRLIANVWHDFTSNPERLRDTCRVRVYPTRRFFVLLIEWLGRRAQQRRDYCLNPAPAPTCMLATLGREQGRHKTGDHWLLIQRPPILTD